MPSCGLTGEERDERHQTLLTAARGGDLAHGRVHQWRAAAQTWLDRPLLGAYAEASLRHQGPSPVRFAHDLPLEAAAELGIPGPAIVLALYAAVVALLWGARRGRSAWLLAPAVAAFPLMNLVDWPWHIPALGAAWALALGALAARATGSPL